MVEIDKDCLSKCIKVCKQEYTITDPYIRCFIVYIIYWMNTEYMMMKSKRKN